MKNQLVQKLLVSAIALAAATSISAAPVSHTSNAFVSLTIAQHATALHKGEVVTGPLAASQSMPIAISLKLRNQDQLHSFMAKAAKRGTPSAKRGMTQAQFVAQYSATEAQAQAVANYLTSAGFKNVKIASNRQLVTANATADTVRAAFHTSFESVRTLDGRSAYHNTSDVLIPSSLKETVLSVVGLDNVHISHILAQRAVTPPAPLPPNPGNTFLTSTAVGHEPTDFPSIYGADMLASASSVNVGIITAGSLDLVQKDLVQFANTNNLGPIANTIVQVGPTSTDISGDLEWDMDSQSIVGMSGGVGNLFFYNTTSLADVDLTNDYNQVVTDGLVSVINVSLGECEADANAAGTTAAEDQIFEQAAVTNQTFSVSSGDSGANECGIQQTEGLTPGTTPSWPASSQYVVAVGGTEVYTTATGTSVAPTWLSEIVWNNKNEGEGATGGSPSTFEPQPSWQAGAGQGANSTMRGVPDIAFDGSPDSGALVIVDGKADQQIGGTSLSSPLFVGAWARVIANYNNDQNAYNCTSGLPACGNMNTQFSLGFAPYLLYTAPAQDFQDIVSGNNGGETAAPGWDYTSGYGSPIISNMLNDAEYWSTTPSGPTASFSYVEKGLQVNFVDNSSDSYSRISTYVWDFGDNSTGSNLANPSHTYTGGTYTVTETVTDSTGSGSTTSQQVISPVPVHVPVPPLPTLPTTPPLPLPPLPYVPSDPTPPLPSAPTPPAVPVPG